MLSTRSLLLSLCASLMLMVLISSCDKSAPTACFQIDTLTDSMKVGNTIIFDARCSNGASKYYWDFGNGMDTTAGPLAQTRYTTAKTYTVSLVVTNGGKTATVNQSVVITP